MLIDMTRSSNPHIMTVGNQNQPQITWEDRCKEFLNQIKKMKPKDRLEHASCISDVITAISMVVHGWAQWYKTEFLTAFGSKPLSAISEEEFNQIFKFFRTVAINVLEFDIQFTEVMKTKNKKQQKKKPKRKPKNGRREYSV